MEPREKSKACRQLFASDSEKDSSEKDSDESREACEAISERHQEQAKEKWNFDFETGKPLPGKYDWEVIPDEGAEKDDDGAPESPSERALLPSKRRRTAKWAVRATVASSSSSVSPPEEEPQSRSPHRVPSPLGVKPQSLESPPRTTNGSPSRETSESSTTDSQAFLPPENTARSPDERKTPSPPLKSSEKV